MDAPDAATRVAEALEQDALERALELALQAWREAPSAAIADAIERLDALTRARFPGPKGRTKEAFQAAWMRWAEEESSDVATGWLAATLTSKLPMARSWEDAKKHVAMVRRLKALERRPADPRIASAAVRLVVDGKIPLAGWDPHAGSVVYGRCLNLLVTIGDTRHAGRLDKVRRHPHSKQGSVRLYLSRVVGKTLEELGPHVPEDPAEAKAWAAVAPGPATSTRRVDPEQLRQFLAAIYQEPEVEDLRLVYADLLQEAGDPRGQFIALQVAASRGPVTKTMEKTTRKLLRDHKREWLGDALGVTLTRVEFERGFLASASVARHAAADEKIWKLAAADDRIQTLHTLRKGSANVRNYRSFIHAARNLRCLDAPNGVFLEAIAELPGRDFRALACERQPNRKRLRLMAKKPCFEHLESLEVAVTYGAEERFRADLEATGWLERLKTLSLTDQSWWDGSMPDTFALSLWPQVPQTLVTLEQRTQHTHVTLRRLAEGCEVELELFVPAEGVDEALVVAMPSDVTSIHVRKRGGRSLRPFLAALAKQRPHATVVKV